ncbi:MAG: RNA methyltransferase, partial [Trebonia sp.]
SDGLSWGLPLITRLARFSERTGLAPRLILALDGVTAGAWKASAGALARLPVARAVNLTRTLRAYQEGGFFVAGLDTAGDTEVRDIPVADGPLVLVVGSEGRGLSRVVAAACDLLVRIPMASGTESLNAGVAASIALYEIATARSRLA